MGRVVRVERVRVERLSGAVSLFGDGERITVGWDDPIELVDGDEVRAP